MPPGPSSRPACNMGNGIEGQREQGGGLGEENLGTPPLNQGRGISEKGRQRQRPGEPAVAMLMGLGHSGHGSRLGVVIDYTEPVPRVQWQRGNDRVRGSFRVIVDTGASTWSLG